MAEAVASILKADWVPLPPLHIGFVALWQQQHDLLNAVSVVRCANAR